MGVPCLWPSDRNRRGTSVTPLPRDKKFVLLSCDTFCIAINSQEYMKPIGICITDYLKRNTTDAISMLLF